MPVPEIVERLRATAMTLLSRGTFATVSVPQIAAASGVAVGSLYRHFASKEALLSDAHRAARHEVASRVTAAVAGASGPDEAVDAWLDALADMAVGQPDLLCFLARHGDASGLDAATRLADEQAGASVRRILREASPGGSADPDALIAMVMGAAAGLAASARNGLTTKPAAASRQAFLRLGRALIGLGA